MRYLGIELGLVAFWVALWGEVTVANVVGGVLIASLVLLVAPLPRPLRGELVMHPVGIAIFVAFFLRELVKASAVVALIVVRRPSSVSPGIVAVPLSSDSDALTTIVADAVSLTPGTLTVEVDSDPPVLYIHVLHLIDVDQVKADVATLERHVTRAFGSKAAIAALTANTVRGAS